MRVLIPTAGQVAAEKMAFSAMRCVAAMKGSAVILHVLDEFGDPEAGLASNEILCRAADHQLLERESCLRSGNVIEQIVDFAQSNDIDLILMGASNGQVLEKWLSSDVQGRTEIPVVVLSNVWIPVA